MNDKLFEQIYERALLHEEFKRIYEQAKFETEIEQLLEALVAWDAPKGFRIVGGPKVLESRIMTLDLAEQFLKKLLEKVSQGVYYENARIEKVYYDSNDKIQTTERVDNPEIRIPNEKYKSELARLLRTHKVKKIN